MRSIVLIACAIWSAGSASAQELCSAKAFMNLYTDADHMILIIRSDLPALTDAKVKGLRQTGHRNYLDPRFPIYDAQEKLGDLEAETRYARTYAADLSMPRKMAHVAQTERTIASLMDSYERLGARRSSGAIAAERAADLALDQAGFAISAASFMDACASDIEAALGLRPGGP